MNRDERLHADADYQRWLDQKARARAIEFELASTRPGAAKSVKCAVPECVFPALVGGLCHTCNLREVDPHMFENRNGGSANVGIGELPPRSYQVVREPKEPKAKREKPDRLLEFAIELGPRDRRELEIGPLDTVGLEEWRNPEVGSAC